MTEEEREQEEQQERARPKVVDKRTSSRGTAPREPAAPPSPEPARPSRPAGPQGSVAEPQRPAGPQGSVAEPQGQAAGPQGAVSEPQGQAAGPQGAAAPQGGPEDALWTPEQEAEAERVAREIAARSSLEWVVNVAVTLANVAGTKLDSGAPGDARLAIDALAAIVNGLGSSLSDAETPLRQTLAQLQLAYAQASGPPVA